MQTSQFIWLLGICHEIHRLRANKGLMNPILPQGEKNNTAAGYNAQSFTSGDSHQKVVCFNTDHAQLTAVECFKMELLIGLHLVHLQMCFMSEERSKSFDGIILTIA